MVTWVWIVWMLAGLLIEFYALANRVPGDTLSELVWAVTKRYPLVPLAFGLLAGHWFWNRS